jgi:hypothetical protein
MKLLVLYLRVVIPGRLIAVFVLLVPFSATLYRIIVN